jgi:AcrR family transcriptional regulator
MTAAPEPAEAKRYHHGDLRRALLDAAIAIVERDGAHALTLRAVAREAGVSPAAPYHHFKDKDELLDAVSREGFRRQRQAMAMARASCGDTLGVAYVEFANAHPALYRVMYDSARNMERLPEDSDDGESGFDLARRIMDEASGGKLSELDLALSVIASWCAAHGVAEISAFPQFQPLRDALGGERAFIEAVFAHLGRARLGEVPKREEH